MRLINRSAPFRTALELLILVMLAAALGREVWWLRHRPVAPELQRQVEFLNDGGQYLYGAQQYSKAAEQFIKAVELWPEYGPAWLNLGYTRLELDDLEGAREAFERALALGSRPGLAHRGLGIYYTRKHQPARATTHLELALADEGGSTGEGAGPASNGGASRPGDGAASPGGGGTGAGRSPGAGDQDGATIYARSQAHMWLAEALRMEGLTSEAVSHAQEASRLAPLDPMVGLIKGRALWAAGRRKEAVKAIEDGLAAGRHLLLVFKDPDTGKTELTTTVLARLYMEMGDYATAQQHLRYSLENASFAAQARQLLSRCEALAPGSPPEGIGAMGVGGSAPSSSAGVAPASSAAPGSIAFTDATRSAGLGRWEHNAGPTILYNPESTPPGCAMLDLDGDGYLDLFVPTGANAGSDGSLTRTNTNVVWRNRGDATFEEVTGPAGLAGSGFGQGCVAADIDNDGYVDLFVTGFGAWHLYRNNGDGTFTETTADSGLTGGIYSTAAALADFDRDGLLDLYVGQYTSMDYRHPPPSDQFIVRGEDCAGPASIGPEGMPALPSLLFRSLGGGRFEDVSERALHIHRGLVQTPTLGAIWTDENDDGWPDLVVANDSRSANLYENQRDGTFREVAFRRWLADVRGNMGVDAADCDNDGHLDLVVTHWVNEETGLFLGLPSGGYRDVAVEAGMTKKAPDLTGWGVGFADFDNDGWLDVFVSNGMTCAAHYDTATYAHTKNLLRGQPSQVFRGKGGGRFEEVSDAAGLTALAPRVGRGAALGDVDNDGGTDVLVANNNGPVYLLRNATRGRGHWLDVELVGVQSNRTVAGAKVSIVAGDLRGLQETHAGSSYMSSSSPWPHFGLGERARVDRVDVRWPSGRTSTHGPFAADRRVRIVEPAAAPAGRLRQVPGH